MPETPVTEGADEPTQPADAPKPIDLTWLEDDGALGAIVHETAEDQIPSEGPIPLRPPLVTPIPGAPEVPVAPPRLKLPKVRSPQEVAAASTAFKDMAPATPSTPDDVKKLNTAVLDRLKVVKECFEGAAVDLLADKQFMSMVTNYLVLVNAQYVTTGRLPPTENPANGASDVPLPAGLAPELAGLGATKSALRAGLDVTDASNDGD